MILKGIEIYHPENLVTNEYYLERFEDKKSLLYTMFERMSKQERYIVDSSEENSLTMAQKAVEKLLSDVSIDRNEIGGVLYVSQTPEYLIPTSAVLIHKMFGLPKDCFCIDMNVNCAGMVTAFETAYQHFRSHEGYKYILLVGSEFHSKHSSKECVFTYPIFGDMGCAVLLERGEDDFLASAYYTNSKNAELILFPQCGTSRIYEEALEKHIHWGSTTGSVEAIFGPGVKRIELLLEKHGITKDEIGMVCCNQQTESMGEFVVNALGLPDDKTCYIGDKYGYTGSTAAFVSLYHGLKEGRIKDKQYIVFCCAGAGGVLSIVLYRYEGGK